MKNIFRSSPYYIYNVYSRPGTQPNQAAGKARRIRNAGHDEQRPEQRRRRKEERTNKKNGRIRRKERRRRTERDGRTRTAPRRPSLPRRTPPGIYHRRTGPKGDASGVARRGVFIAKRAKILCFNSKLSDCYSVLKGIQKKATGFRPIAFIYFMYFPFYIRSLLVSLLKIKNL